MMYGRGSTPGSAPRRPAMPVPSSTAPSQTRHPAIEAVLEQIERQRAGRDEEHEDPDRPVVEPVIELVALANLAFGGVLDGNGCHVMLCARSWVFARLRRRGFRACLDLTRTAVDRGPTFER